jgi:uncharacterized protein
VAVIVGLVLPVRVLSADAGSVAFQAGGTRLAAPVISLHELRQAKLVRQNWDISCGAAALSTVLTYHYKYKISERDIILAILSEADPRQVRSQGGFSLLDLKLFVESIGYQGKGYGELMLQDLVDFGVPAIIPVQVRGYDHFIVFRGFLGNRVLLGDPAFGNLTMTIERFADIWQSGIGFIVLPKGAVAPKLIPMAPEVTALPVPDLRRVSRLLRGSGPVPPIPPRLDIDP